MLQKVEGAVIRDRFGAIRSSTLPQSIEDLTTSILTQMEVSTGIVGEADKWWESVNYDVYGYDVDRNLVVIQLRRAVRKRSWSYQSVQKQYFLAGLDEGQAFSHPLPSSPRRMGGGGLDETTPEGVVKWSEAKIFGVPLQKLPTVIRQGDIAIVPLSRKPSSLQPDAEFVQLPTGVWQGNLRNSHIVTVDGEILSTGNAGRWYVEGDVEIVHDKQEHRAISYSGKGLIVVGQRDGLYSWVGRPLGD